MSHEVDGVDYGPLRHLVGSWEGNKGMDVAPEPDGDEHNPYYESLLFEPIGTVTNAESQDLAALRYHHVVSRISNDQIFHNETGYWMWDADQGLIMQTLTIPRGVCLVAGGSHEAEGEGVRIQVHASRNDANWPIIESPFMRDNASTLSFHRIISVDEGRLHYEETTVVDIYGKRFDHTDENALVRVGSN
jgi:hypothetical protein